MSLLSKLTIIVLSYNRKPYVLRTLSYWSGSEVTLHVLDGSSQHIDAKDLAKFASNVNYHYLPISYIERLKQAIMMPLTEYTVLLGDDDFFLHSGLEACISEIESIEDLVSCMGRSLAFLPDQNKVKGWPDSLEMREYSISQDDPIDRMIFHMAPYTCSTIYSVVKTNVWKLAMTSIAKKDFQIHALEELQFELGICYLGKSKVIENLMWLRSHENPPIRKSQPTLKSVPVWWKDEKMKKEHEEFLRIMSDTLNNGKFDNIESICNGIQKAMDAYMAQPAFNNPQIITLQNKIRSFIVNLLPIKVKVLLKTLLVSEKSEKKEEHISLIGAAKNLEDTGVLINFEELNQIVNIVKDFHN